MVCSMEFEDVRVLPCAGVDAQPYTKEGPSMGL